MNIIEFHSHKEEDGTLKIQLNSSFDLFGADCSLGSVLANGSTGFMNWNIELKSYEPIIVEAKSVLDVKERTLLKIPSVIGTTFIFNKVMFHSIGRSSEYHILDKKVPGLRTGSEIESFSASYKYELSIYGSKAEDLKSVIFTASMEGGKVEKRSYDFNRKA